MWLLDIRLEPSRGWCPLEGRNCCGEERPEVKFQSRMQRKNDLHDGSAGRRLGASQMPLRQSGAIGARKGQSTIGNGIRTG